MNNQQQINSQPRQLPNALNSKIYAQSGQPPTPQQTNMAVSTYAYPGSQAPASGYYPQQQSQMIYRTLPQYSTPMVPQQQPSQFHADIPVSIVVPNFGLATHTQPVVSQPYMLQAQSTGFTYQMPNPNFVTSAPAPRPQQNVPPHLAMRPTFPTNQMIVHYSQAQPPANKPRKIKITTNSGEDVKIPPKPELLAAKCVAEKKKERERLSRNFRENLIKNMNSKPSEQPTEASSDNNQPINKEYPKSVMELEALNIIGNVEEYLNEQKEATNFPSPIEAPSSLPADDSSLHGQIIVEINMELNCEERHSQTSSISDSEILCEEELAKQIHEFERTPDVKKKIYNREFLLLLRRAKLPNTPENLKELGIDKESMPESPHIKINPSPKIADSKTNSNQQIRPKTSQKFANEDTFKPHWQQNQPQQPRIVSVYHRPHQYQGRNSDNRDRGKLKKNLYVERASYGHGHQYNKGPRAVAHPSSPQLTKSQTDQSQPTSATAKSDSEIQQELPRKAANAWKPKRSAPPKDEEEEKCDKIKKEIRGLLNKITPSTYEELSDQFCAFKIYEDPQILAIIIDLIFDKAVEEPHFCPLYSDLCKKQVDVELQNQARRTGAFKNAIILKSQHTFLASKEYDEKMAELGKKLQELDISDEKGREKIKEEQEMRQFKEKRRLLGIVKFVGQLYRHIIIIEKIVDWCAIELIKRYQTTFEEDYLEYAVELMETVGAAYEKRLEMFAKQIEVEKEKLSLAQKIVVADKEKTAPENHLEQILGHLDKLKPQVSNRIRFAILDLEDLRKRKWVALGGEKGPKTIDQVHEEAEKEQRQNEYERLEHERERQREREQAQLFRRGPNGPRPYLGRNSSDRRNFPHPRLPYPGRGSADRLQKEHPKITVLQRLHGEKAPESRIKNSQHLDVNKPLARNPWYNKPQQSQTTPLEKKGGDTAGTSSTSAADADGQWRVEGTGKDAKRKEESK